MTCPTCGRHIRAELLDAAAHHLITVDAFTSALTHIDTTQEHTMHARLIFNPVNGDIGIEEEEQEVLPDHVPAETPVEAPAVPVPA